MTGALDRRAVVAALLRDPADLLLVSGLGAPTYDVAAAGDRSHNFYLWGAMGGATMVGLGLALAQPDRRVLVITGDGEMLMGIGSLATIAVAGARNLAIVVLDNGSYGETGAQPTHTALGADLAAVAAGCGWRATATAATMEEVEALQPRLRAEALFAVIKISAAEAAPTSPTGSAVRLQWPGPEVGVFLLVTRLVARPPRRISDWRRRRDSPKMRGDGRRHARKGLDR